MKKNKFYEFKNEGEESYGLYIYGALTDDKESDWFATNQDVDLTDFKEALNKINKNSTLNMYVNSPGGSVFASSTMASMLQRAKETKNIKIVSYIDGLCASATSFLIMVSDEIKLYTNSMLMVHKPMSIAIGNADDMQKEIETLNSIEQNVMIPLYMQKAKCSEDVIKDLIDKESWLSAKEVDDYFDVLLLDTAKECTACVDSELFKRYKNVPEILKEEEEEEEESEKEEKEPQTEEKPQEEEQDPEKEEESTEQEEETPVEEPAKEQEPDSEPQEEPEEGEKEPQEEEKEEEQENPPSEEETNPEEPETTPEEEEEEEEDDPKQQNVVKNPQDIDYSYFENRLNNLKGEK